MRRKARGKHKALRIVRMPSLEVEDARLLPQEREIILHDINNQHKPLDVGGQ